MEGAVDARRDARLNRRGIHRPTGEASRWGAGRRLAGTGRGKGNHYRKIQVSVRSSRTNSSARFARRQIARARRIPTALVKEWARCWWHAARPRIHLGTAASQVRSLRFQLIRDRAGPGDWRAERPAGRPEHRRRPSRPGYARLLRRTWVGTCSVIASLRPHHRLCEFCRSYQL